jgi:hypothetical protein
VKRNRLLMPGASIANPMPRKRKPPLTSPAPKVSEGKLWWVEYVHHKHTLPAEHLTTREIETTILFICSSAQKIWSRRLP